MSDPTPGRPGNDTGGNVRYSERLLLLWSGAVLAALVVLAVVFSFAGDAELDPGTPERVVQDYVRAVIADELDGCGGPFPALPG